MRKFIDIKLCKNKVVDYIKIVHKIQYFNQFLYFVNFFSSFSVLKISIKL